MDFRPCIDIHDGKVKQIVGSSLTDSNGARENFVSTQDASFYGEFYEKRGIKGGHVIMLNKPGTLEYELTKSEAIKALNSYKNSLQIGGGINAENAMEFINQGASHVIVTSYVFKDGKINYDNLKKIVSVVGKKHLVLDLSCRKKGGEYYIVTDRWQKFTDTKLSVKLLNDLDEYADEYLIHAVDVEGKAAGPDESLLKILASYNGITITYAGGVGNFEDLTKIKESAKGRINVTIGSALDIFGGSMDFDKVIEFCKNS